MRNFRQPARPLMSDMLPIGVVEGDRVELVHMPDDPNPIEPGTRGTVTNVHQSVGIIGVRWDNGRGLNLVVGKDIYTKIANDV